MADITLPQQPVFNIPRDFVNQLIDFTDINGSLYLALDQICTISGLTLKTVREHITALQGMSTNSTGGAPPPPCYLSVYSIPVFYPGQPGSNREGVTNLTSFYHTDLFLAVVSRMANSQRKFDIQAWTHSIVSTYIQQGFAVDKHALQNDPLVLPRFEAVTKAHNFSKERQEFAEVWHLLLWLLRHCTGTLMADGKVSPMIVNEFMRSAYNSLYVSATGCSGKWMRDVRANQIIITFGQTNYRGKYSPRKQELGTHANFLHDFELAICNGSAKKAAGFIMYHIHTYGSIAWNEALQLFSMACHSHHTPWYGDHLSMWPKTLHDLNTPKGDAPYLVKRQQYLENFPNRHKARSMEERIEMFHIGNEILYEAISSVDIHGTIIDDDDLLDPAGYIPKYGHMPRPCRTDSKVLVSRGFDL